MHFKDYLKQTNEMTRRALEASTDREARFHMECHRLLSELQKVSEEIEKELNDANLIPQD